MADVHIDSYGAVGDGVTDDFAALQAAYTACAGGTLTLGPKTYALSQGLIMTSPGGHIKGTYGSVDGGGTELKALTSGMYFFLIVKSYNCSIKGAYLNGANLAEHGVVCQRAGQDVLQDLMIRSCTGNAVRLDMGFDPEATQEASNNNYLRLERVIGQLCGGDGLHTVEGNDNNAVVVRDCTFGVNAGHGVLLKGMGWLIDGGNYESNGEHGIQISEPGDQGNSMFSILRNPWIESNGNNYAVEERINYGYLGGGKSLRNTVMMNSLAPFRNDPGSLDIHIAANTGAQGRYEIRGGFGANASIQPGTASVVYAATGSVANVPIYVRPQSAPLHLCDQDQGVTIGGGDVLKKYISKTVPWSGQVSHTPTRIRVSVAGAEPGDIVMVSHDALGNDPIELAGQVVESGVVVVTIKSSNGHSPPIESGNLRISVLCH